MSHGLLLQRMCLEFRKNKPFLILLQYMLHLLSTGIIWFTFKTHEQEPLATEIQERRQTKKGGFLIQILIDEVRILKGN